MCGLSGKFLLRVFLLNMVHIMTCEELTNTVFNANIRDYAVKEDGIETNTSNVRTLQKEEVGRYASFAPIRNPIRFKEIPDNALSSSSYSRGLLHHEHGGHDHGGYGLHDGFYEDGSPYGHGYEYVHSDDHHDFDHHDSDHHGHGHHFGHHHHSGHGHHHKHHDHHHLATKALLWPIAGIALLGAAAALVTNPVLLQLGVVSGKRRRRDTEEVSGPDFASDEDWPLDPYGKQSGKVKEKRTPKKDNGGNDLKRGHKKVTQIQSQAVKDTREVTDRFVPIPLKLRGD